MPHCRQFLASSSLLPLLLLVTSPAGATYSIVATDQGTQAVGGAVTSCVGSQGVLIVYGPAPGYGGINAQAAALAKGRDRGVVLLQMGTAPADIIQQITASSFDTGSASRQYGVADLQGRAAGFTGTSTLEYSDHLTGNLGTFTYAIQGNILTSAAVLSQTEAAFRNQGCDLPERLMRALEGGAQNGEGDSRCTTLSPSVPANAASIEVDLVGQSAGSYLRLSNAQNGSVNAVVQLRSQFNTWRQTHPCMQPDGGTPDAGSKDASATDVLPDRRDGGAPSDGADASDGSAGTGGTAGAGGQDGAAGTGGVAGSSGTGGASGAAGVGGSSGAAGVGGSSGAAGTGGATGGTAGKAGAGGTSGSGGATGTGGASGGSGGAGATGGTGGSGGVAGAGTTGGSGGKGGSGGTAGKGGSAPDDGGCSCRIGSGTNFNAAAAGVGSLLALTTAIRRRGAKRRRAARR